MKTYSLATRKIFSYLMENGFNPKFEDGCIIFDIDETTSILEYDDGILTLRTFFTIEEEEFDMFLEASNLAMLKSTMMKAVIIEDMNSIMFSCETYCDNVSDFKRYFPKMLESSRKGIKIHKTQMKELIRASELASRKMPATDELIGTGISRGKPLS